MKHYISRFQFGRDKQRTPTLQNPSPIASLFYDLSLLVALSFAPSSIEKRAFVSYSSRPLMRKLIGRIESRLLVHANRGSGLLRSLVLSRNFLWAKAVTGKGLLEAKDHAYLQVNLYQDSRPAIPLCLGETISLSPSAGSEGTELVFHLCALESLSPALRNQKVKLSVEVAFAGADSLKKEITCGIEGGDELWILKPGQSWAEFSLSLPKTPREIKFRVEAGSQREALPQFALGSPRLVSKNQRGSKVVMIVVESMSELSLVEKIFQAKAVDGELLAALGTTAVKFHKGFSAGDSTLPAAGTFATGAYPSQHLVGDYKPNPWRNVDCPELSTAVATVAERLAEKNIATFLRASLQRFSPVYGFSRGFEGAYIRQDENVALEANFLKSLEAKPGFLFSHIDTMHFPLSWHAHGSGADPQISLDSANPAAHYMNQTKRSLDLAVQLIDQLKSSGEWESTTFLLTGDHGASLPPWKKGLENSLYQLRTNVPLYVKLAQGVSTSLPPAEAIVEAHALATHLILSTFGLESKYELASLPSLGAYARSESTHQPGKSDYAACLTFDKFRYFHRAKVDWQKRKYLQPVARALYEFDAVLGRYREDINVLDKHPSLGPILDSAVSDFVEKGANGILR